MSLFIKNEKIHREDYFRIASAALLGMCINMLMFFKGLQLSTPINSGVIVTLTPIIILVLSAFFLKEKLTTKKVIGIFLGFVGAVMLVIYGSNSKVINAPNTTNLQPNNYHSPTIVPFGPRSPNSPDH